MLCWFILSTDHKPAPADAKPVPANVRLDYWADRRNGNAYRRTRGKSLKRTAQYNKRFSADVLTPSQNLPTPFTITTEKHRRPHSAVWCGREVTVLTNLVNSFRVFLKYKMYTVVVHASRRFASFCAAARAISRRDLSRATSTVRLSTDSSRAPAVSSVRVSTSTRDDVDAASLFAAVIRCCASSCAAFAPDRYVLALAEKPLNADPHVSLDRRGGARTSGEPAPDPGCKIGVCGVSADSSVMSSVGSGEIFPTRLGALWPSPPPPWSDKGEGDTVTIPPTLPPTVESPESLTSDCDAPMTLRL